MMGKIAKGLFDWRYESGGSREREGEEVFVLKLQTIISSKSPLLHIFGGIR